MARTKQATPLRRDPSSEYFSKSDMGTPSRSPRNLNNELNGTATGGDDLKESLVKSFVPEVEMKKEAGALQFLIAVGGIYGSLYFPLSY